MALPDHIEVVAKKVHGYVQAIPKEDITPEKLYHLIYNSLCAEEDRWSRQRRIDLLADSVGYRDF